MYLRNSEHTTIYELGNIGDSLPSSERILFSNKELKPAKKDFKGHVKSLESFIQNLYGLAFTKFLDTTKQKGITYDIIEGPLEGLTKTTCDISFNFQGFNFPRIVRLKRNKNEIILVQSIVDYLRNPAGSETLVEAKKYFHIQAASLALILPRDQLSTWITSEPKPISEYLKARPHSYVIFIDQTSEQLLKMAQIKLRYHSKRKKEMERWLRE